MSDYRTHEQLEITQAEFEGLVRLKEHFEHEAISVIPGRDLWGMSSYHTEKIDTVKAPLGFDMGYGAAVVDKPEVYHCGCAACIGGHLSLTMQGADIRGNLFSRNALVAANDYVDEQEYHPTLGGLFYPHVILADDWKKISPQMAAQAIESVLITGRADWKKIAESHGLRTGEEDDED